METVSSEIAINSKKNTNPNQKEIKKSVEVENQTVQENKVDEKEKTQEIVPNEVIEEKEVIETIPISLSTEVIKENNLQENYNVEYKSVRIKNETNFNLTQDILTPNIDYSNKSNIIIFHTHTCESYTQTKENSYISSGNFRTTNLEYSVAKVRKCFIRKFDSKRI